MDKKEERDLLTPNGGMSSIRYVMLRILRLITVSLGVMLAIFVYQAYKGEAIDWVGGAAFISGLGVLLTGVAGSKAYQKRSEE